MRGFIGGIAVVVAGCASAPPQDSFDRDAALKAALSGWFACGIKNVDRLDDGKSDPYSVALALRSSCTREQLAIDEVQVRGRSDAFKSTYYGPAMELNRNNFYASKFTELVLDFRKSKSR